MFSNRLDINFSENQLTRAFHQRLSGGLRIIDLTTSNPTMVGLDSFSKSKSHLLNIQTPEVYKPDPLGSRTARQAIVAYYGDRGLSIEAEQVILTTSTSEAYTWIFKLLCDPFDSILAPSPATPF